MGDFEIDACSSEDASCKQWGRDNEVMRGVRGRWQFAGCKHWRGGGRLLVGTLDNLTLMFTTSFL